MVPRGALDIGWIDLAAALASCLLPSDAQECAARAESAWGPQSLACLSVRSGLDSVLEALQFPPGAEVLISAITISDIVRILEHHGLVPVPLDVDPETLAVPKDAFAAAATPRTRAVLVAHLFGSRMPMNDAIAFARARGLVVLEDCAQAYDGSDFRGHPESDASFFSFGPIKTATALGGALLRFKDAGLLAKVRAVQEKYPRQKRTAFLSRVLHFSFLKLLTLPNVFGLFARSLNSAGRDIDGILRNSVRGFGTENLLPALRRRPGAPQLQLIRRRVRQERAARIKRRAAYVEKAAGLLPREMRVGAAAPGHSHWVFPVRCQRPDACVKALRSHGFDATRFGSSLIAVPPPDGKPEPARARELLDELVYLPMFPAMRGADMRRLADLAGRHAPRGFSSRRP